MEYKRHPEINEGWVEYCKEMYEYSGKTTEIQEHTFKWRKNSIHSENGGGSYLTQEEVRELVEYCKERFMNVIPEVPCLSHCDYLLIRHHELAERQNDPYPDTYCPSNPDSYKLLFEVMEEIIDVFEPTIMNIGHDEYYSIGICDRCKDKKAEELFAGDIIKIHDFLAGHGIKTMIWGDKLLNAFNKQGVPCGGAERPMYKNYDPNDEFWGVIPATYKSIDLIPRDVEILHWYWSIDGKLEEEFLKRGFEVTYGNFRGSELIDRNNRLGKGVKGGIVSNWSTLKEENLQRNGIMFNMLYNQIMFWNKDYKDSMYEETRELVFNELYWYKYRGLMQQGAENKNVGKPAYIEITHTTDNEFKYVQFVDGVYIETDKYIIGHYVLEYDDGTKEEIPIIYGWNISSMNLDWERKENERLDAYKFDNRLFEAASTSRPMKIDGYTWYKFIIANPCPDKTIKGIHVKNRNEGKNIYIKEIRLV